MKILCAISGGVDSAVAAAILKKRGHELIGVYLDLFGVQQEEIESARAVATKLKIPFYVLNFRDIFQREVIEYFLRTYANGATPNPCVICNPIIKFGRLLTKARELNCEKLATGHFARIHGNKLLRGIDVTKDQSYFLCRLTSRQLSHVIFPLGKKTKTEVKKLAQNLGFVDQAKKKESSGICFLEKKDVADFLAENLPKKNFQPGPIRILNGKIVGQHQGLLRYTIGQRRGIKVGGMKEPFFVAGFNRQHNELLITPDAKLFSQKLQAKKLSFVNEPPKFGEKIFAQIRYRHPATPARIFPHKTIANLEFEKPQRAITSGQTVVFYRGATCLGCGEIV